MIGDRETRGDGSPTLGLDKDSFWKKENNNNNKICPTSSWFLQNSLRNHCSLSRPLPESQENMFLQRSDPLGRTGKIGGQARPGRSRTTVSSPLGCGLLLLLSSLWDLQRGSTHSLKLWPSQLASRNDPNKAGVRLGVCWCVCGERHNIQIGFAGRGKDYCT